MNKWLVTGAIIFVALVIGVVVNTNRHPASDDAQSLTPDGQTAQQAVQQPQAAVAPRPSVTKPTDSDVAASKAAGMQHATITTEKGAIEVELDGKDAPLSVANFVKLSQAKFYDGLTFHRVEPGFVIQGGDPNGDGSGGPGYNIKLEIAPNLKHIEGALAWARTNDPDSAGSQFYITLAATPSLDGKYAVFGKVTKGMDVVKSIAKGDKIVSVVVKK